MSVTKIILYSHGFGVEKDDRGLFTDIANSLGDFRHIMFDYNRIDEQSNTLTVTSLHKQADMLKRQYDILRNSHPDATIDLICHSQGSIAAGLANLHGISKIVLLAPPTRFLGSETKLEQMSERQGTQVQDDGTVSYPRRDGSTTIIKQDYWQSRNAITDPIALYNQLAQNTEVTIINALNDEVLGETNHSKLSDTINLVHQEANHDFTGNGRPVLLKTMEEIFNQ